MSSRFWIRLQVITRAFRALCASLLRRCGATPDKPTPENVQRILVAHHFLLGDTILLAGLLKKIRHHYPHAQCVVLCQPAYLALFANQPYGCSALAHEPRNAASIQAILQSGPYDLAFIPDDNRYAWLARAAGARWIIGFAHDAPAWKNWQLDEAIPFAPAPESWTEMSMRLVTGDNPPPYQAGEWPITPTHSNAHVLPSPPYIVLHVGASSPLRYWPAAHWRSLAKQLAAIGLQPVWSAGPGEEALVTEIDSEGHFPSYAGRLDLPSLYALFCAAQAIIVPDTGAAHLARLSGTPTIMLFGPGSATLHGDGNFWQQCRTQIINEPHMPCRNQTVYFRRDVAWVQRCKRIYTTNSVIITETACPVAHCMSAINPNTVFTLIQQLGGKQ